MLMTIRSPGKSSTCESGKQQSEPVCTSVNVYAGLATKRSAVLTTTSAVDSEIAKGRLSLPRYSTVTSRDEPAFAAVTVNTRLVKRTAYRPGTGYVSTLPVPGLAGVKGCWTPSPMSPCDVTAGTAD